MEKPQVEETKDWYKIYTRMDIYVLIFSIVIPIILVAINQYIFTCGHHGFNKLKAGAWGWVLGRALGFSCLIWFTYAILKGFRVKNTAKLLKDMKKAKSFHCRTAIIAILLLSIHVILLVSNEPWRSIILRAKVKHLPYVLYVIKLWTGIVYGAIMVGSSLLFIYLKDMQRLREFGYKRFIKVHRIMLICAIILIVHVILINTEFWLWAIAGKHFDD